MRTSTQASESANKQGMPEELRKKGAKRAYAYQYIRNAILHNEMKPGQIINEVTLCEQLNGISRTPVHDALQQLAHEGLIENTPGRGMVVASIHFEDLIEITEIRMAIESLAIQLCIARATEEDYEALKQNVQEHKRFHEENNYQAAVACDNQFHHLIAAASHNTRCCAIVDNLIEQNQRGAYMTSSDENRIGSSVKMHAEILDAILKKDEAAAVALLREHLQGVTDYVVSVKLGNRFVLK